MNIYNKTKLSNCLLYILILLAFSSCSISKCRYSSGFRIDLGGRKESVGNTDKKTKYCKMNSFKKFTSNNVLSSFTVSDSSKMVLSSDITKTETDNAKFKNSFFENKVYQSKSSNKVSSKTFIASKKIKSHESKASVLGDVLLEILKALLFVVLLSLIVVGMAYLFVGLLFLISADLGLIFVLFLLFLFATIALMALLSYLFGYDLGIYRPRTSRINLLGSGRTSLFRIF